MRSEKEIREIIADIEVTIKNTTLANNMQELPKELFESMVRENECMLKALQWVLGDID